MRNANQTVLELKVILLNFTCRVAVQWGQNKTFVAVSSDEWKDYTHGLNLNTFLLHLIPLEEGTLAPH